MELMDGGCLTDVLEQHDSLQMTEAQIAFVCREVMLGLEYIHECHRIHRDIKSDNVLVGGDGLVKIADFGYAAQLSKGKTKRQTIVGVRQSPSLLPLSLSHLFYLPVSLSLSPSVCA